MPPRSPAASATDLQKARVALPTPDCWGRRNYPKKTPTPRLLSIEALREAIGSTYELQRELGAGGMARVHLASGQPGTAMEWLSRAVDEHDPELIYLRVRSEYDALRQDPAFRQLATRVLG